ncbi:inactive tyrosine-protein kinase 7-like [Patiria miniata]|uniref:Ig-like domain-containing protein n=1 Tax=Patiria miniata TaxID=46514 RepID=A0A914BL64_PATMI|nr:inactive tyrosine-protein kinase 7-like [Patiria miniata]
MALKSGRRILVSVFLWVFLSWINCRTVVAQLIVDEGPQDAHVHIGQKVTFVCDLRNTEGYNVFWFHQQRNKYLTTGRQVNVNLMPAELRDRLSVVGRVNQEEFSLRIENVQVADGGEYFCQYVPLIPSGTTTNAGAAVLTVLIPPSPESPYCQVNLLSGTQGDRFEVGDEANFHCYQTDGNPPPDLTLLRGYNQLAGPGRTVTHRYLLTGDDNGVTFTCIMTTPALDEPRNCSVMPLRILPNATILPALSTVEEGDQASFECYGEGEPIIANYRWRVASVDTGEILPADRYSVFENGRSLEIAVMENLELLCIVSVPSGLSGNATARVEVVKREMTSALAGSTVQTSPTNKSSTSAGITAVAVVVPMVIVILVTAVIVLCLRRRRRHKKPNISIRYKSSVIRHREGEPGDDATPGQNGQTTGAGTVWDETGARSEIDTSNLYALPENHQLGPPASQNYHRSSPKLDAVHSAVGPVDPHPDTPVYARPDKKAKNLKENEYSSVPVEEPKEADSGLVYADLELDSSSASKELDRTGLPSGTEQTMYATIRS